MEVRMNVNKDEFLSGKDNAGLSGNDNTILAGNGNAGLSGNDNTILAGKDNDLLRSDAAKIIEESIEAVLPYNAVTSSLDEIKIEADGRLYLISIGKAAWTMAKAAYDRLFDLIWDGIVVTKYSHSQGPISSFRIFEAAHPVPDENSIRAAHAITEMVKDLTPKDTVLLLISGGGSSLVENPLVTLKELQDITESLLKSGADISEVNTIRKHLSLIKGGHLADLIKPAYVEALILSDVIGNDPSTIASGPVSKDDTTLENVKIILNKYNINLNEDIVSKFRETPKEINNVNYRIIGDVNLLCESAKKTCESLGYEAHIINANVEDDADEFADMLGSLARELALSGSTYDKQDMISELAQDMPAKIRQDAALNTIQADEAEISDIDKDAASLTNLPQKKCALIFGGETTVNVKGNGLGGRNQQIALRSSQYIKGIDNVCIFSVGSDGTDGPTDAAGGYADKDTFNDRCTDYLNNNDAYNALSATGDLIFTGPTGTNVNDLAVILVRN